MHRAICGALASACGILTVFAYRGDWAVAFYAGLLAATGLAMLWARACPTVHRDWQVGLTKRVAACALLLPVMDAGYGRYVTWRDKAEGVDEVKPVYSFAEAQGNPSAFGRWWKAYVAEWQRVQREIHTSTPGGPAPYEFLPESESHFFDTTLKVNRLGFLDREFAIDKQDHYRIVVMGSSHVEGPTLYDGDDPWPRQLEQVIHEEVPAGARVEVINAGASAYEPVHCLHRLKTKVLPLNPDMVITYFGYNDFDDYSKDFDLSPIPGVRNPRASLLSSRVEYAFRDWAHRVKAKRHAELDMDEVRANAANCRHAALYRQFVDVAKENGIRLVVCNFNMAVTDDSPADAIAFYEKGFPDLQMQMDANRVNSEVVAAVVQGHPHCTLADVQDGLNGAYEGNYMDLVHLTYQGKQKLAENVCRAIEPILKQDLEHSPGADPKTPVIQVSAEDDGTQLR